MARHMGTYVQSFTKVIDNVLTEDFIRTIEEGTAEWNREEPLRVVLKKGSGGTTYLRIKRYELYPFQAPKADAGAGKKSAISSNQVSVITSKADLDAFLSSNGYRKGGVDLRRAETMINETTIANRQAVEGLREQLISYRERINYLDKKITTARTDKEFQVPRLNQKRQEMEKAHTELEVLRLKKDSAVMALQSAQRSLYEKKRVHESIVIKSSLVTTKRSQTPAEASAEAVIEELEEVLNDARLQHSSSTTDVADHQVVGESSTQSVTEAKIMAVRLLSFINEGENVRVKMAFRVRTVLDEQPAEDPGEKLAAAAQAPQPIAVPPKSRTSIQQDPAKTTAAPAQAPQMSDTSIALAQMFDFQFQLNRVKASGNEVIFYIVATNQADKAQNFVIYDESVGYTLSNMVDVSGDIQTVDLAYMWEGQIKRHATEVHRGITVEPGQSIKLELTFRDISPNLTTVPEFNLYPYIATRGFLGVYSWNSDYVLFTNVRIR
jgi:hypothetical protein